MPTSTLEPLTILAPSPLSETNSADDEQVAGAAVAVARLSHS